MEAAVLPLRRKDLLIEKLENETVVYDPLRHRGHCLNKIALLILESCDGKTKVADMATRLQAQLGTRIGEDAVWFALEQLSKAKLLQVEVSRNARSKQVSRRDLGRKLAAAGVAAVIVTMVAPTAAMAITPGTVPHCGT